MAVIQLSSPKRGKEGIFPHPQTESKEKLCHDNQMEAKTEPQQL